MRNAAKINAKRALELWNRGLTLRQIAADWPGASRMAVSRAIQQAVALGLGQRHPHCAPRGVPKVFCPHESCPLCGKQLLHKKATA